MFYIDGTEYDGVMSLKRTFTVEEDGNGGEALNGRVIRSIIGVRYDYELVIDSDGMTKAQYDALYTTLSAKQVSHTVIIPFGKGLTQWQTFTAYITGGSDELQRIDSDGRVWGNLTVNIYTLSPQIT